MAEAAAVPVVVATPVESGGQSETSTIAAQAATPVVPTESGAVPVIVATPVK